MIELHDIPRPGTDTEDADFPMRPFAAFPDRRNPVSADDILPILPHGIDIEHAVGMRKLLFHLDWIYMVAGFPGVTMEYARRMGCGYALPMAKRLIRFDEETVSRIMFPEDHLDDEETRRFYLRHPDCVDQLWEDVCSYLYDRFPRFEENVAAVSTLFFLSRGNWPEVVELSSIALTRHCVTEYARRGRFDGIVRSVRRTEAEVLATVLSSRRR